MFPAALPPRLLPSTYVARRAHLTPVSTVHAGSTNRRFASAVVTVDGKRVAVRRDADGTPTAADGRLAAKVDLTGDPEGAWCVLRIPRRQQ